MYWISLSIIQDLYKKNLIDLDILEKLNQKNAETFACKCRPIAK